MKKGVLVFVFTLLLLCARGAIAESSIYDEFPVYTSKSEIIPGRDVIYFVDLETYNRCYVQTGLVEDIDCIEGPDMDRAPHVDVDDGFVIHVAVADLGGGVGIVRFVNTETFDWCYILRGYMLRGMSCVGSPKLEQIYLPMAATSG